MESITYIVMRPFGRIKGSETIHSTCTKTTIEIFMTENKEMRWLGRRQKTEVNRDLNKLTITKKRWVYVTYNEKHCKHVKMREFGWDPCKRSDDLSSDCSSVKPVMSASCPEKMSWLVSRIVSPTENRYTILCYARRGERQMDWVVWALLAYLVRG